MANNPTLLTQPIAANGAKNVIPNTTSTAGAMSQDQGFPAETALPLGAGGVAPAREDFNGAFNLLSGIAFMAQKGWVFLFDENQDYFAGCAVRDPLDSKIYEAINDISASSTHPSADSVNWKIADLSAYLPLTGGTMTGNITNALINRSNSTGESIIYGGTGSTDGALIGLRGATNTTYGADQAGSFALSASNGISLLGKTNGALTWNDTPVIYSDGYTTWTDGGAQWYEAIKWSNGRAEIRGRATQAANVLGIQITYPFPFISSITAQVTVDSKVGTGFVAAASFVYYSTTVGYIAIKNLDGSTPTEIISCTYKIEGRWK